MKGYRVKGRLIKKLVDDMRDCEVNGEIVMKRDVWRVKIRVANITCKSEDEE